MMLIVDVIVAILCITYACSTWNNILCMCRIHRERVMHHYINSLHSPVIIAADSGHGTTISEEPQQASRHIWIDSASVADSGHGISILSDPKEISLSLNDSVIARNTKLRILKGKVNVRESVMYLHVFCTNPQIVFSFISCSVLKISTDLCKKCY